MNFEFPSQSWADYEIVDSGNFEKLERFGKYYLCRPEPKALWNKSLPQKEWDKLVHTSFTPGAGFGKSGKEDSGIWKKIKPMNDQWSIKYCMEGGDCFSLRLGLTSFKHVGVFPEQAANWEYIYKNTKLLCDNARKNNLPVPKILNLFAYTGAASLAAKAAGADVVHLDSVRQVVSWARENMQNSNLDGIRWVVEDAMKFVKREVRRGNKYQGIILDPPAYGHGPDGEKWKLDSCLFEMLCLVSQILEHGDSFLVLNLYSNGYSALLGETLVKEALSLKDRKCEIETGELCLKDKFDKALPLSIYVRIRL